MSSDALLEYPAGVSGQVWDMAADGPVHFGRVGLRHGNKPGALEWAVAVGFPVAAVGLAALAGRNWTRLRALPAPAPSS